MGCHHIGGQKVVAATLVAAVGYHHGFANIGLGIDNGFNFANLYSKTADFYLIINTTTEIDTTVFLIAGEVTTFIQSRALC
jgi:hypothetical protein